MQRYVLVLFLFGIAWQTTSAAVLRVESSQFSDEAKLEQDRLVSPSESNVTDETISANDQSQHLIPSDLQSTTEELREVESSQLPDVAKIEQDRLVSHLESHETDETLNTNVQRLYLYPWDSPKLSASGEIEILKLIQEIQKNRKKLAEIQTYPKNLPKFQMTYPENRARNELESPRFIARSVKLILLMIFFLIWILNLVLRKIIKLSTSAYLFL